MATPRETVVITDYDYDDVEIERTIIEQGGFELIAAQCKTEDEVIEVAHDAAAIVAQYATISARVIAALPHCRVIVAYWATIAAASCATSITSSSVLHWAAISSKPPCSMIVRSISTSS